MGDVKPRDIILVAAFVGGLAAIAVGAAIVYLPAGLIVGGVAAVAAAVLYQRGQGE